MGSIGQWYIHKAKIKRARKADKPGASAYSKANVHGGMR
jgi:hypothetical protein